MGCLLVKEAAHLCDRHSSDRRVDLSQQALGALLQTEGGETPCWDQRQQKLQMEVVAVIRSAMSKLSAGGPCLLACSSGKEVVEFSLEDFSKTLSFFILKKICKFP